MPEYKAIVGQPARVSRGKGDSKARPVLSVRKSVKCLAKRQEAKQSLTVDPRRWTQIFSRAKTPSRQREDLLPNRATTIGQNLRASSEICFCLSSSPDKQKVRPLRPLRLCGETLRGSLFVFVCVSRRLIYPNLATFAPLRESSFLRVALRAFLSERA